jgi:hypothetical protein
LTITVVALVVVIAFRRWSVAVVGFWRRSIAGRRGITTYMLVLTAMAFLVVAVLT